MNRLFLLLMALFLTLSTQLFAAGEETQGTRAASTDVPKALSKLHYLKGKPDTKAKYYIYLFSSSRCGRCRAAMPYIVESYDELKKNGFEIIMFGCDSSKEKVEKYAESYNVKFPVLKDSSLLASKVPGYRNVGSLPGIIVVDRNGNEIVKTQPNDFFLNDQWKKYISEDGEGSGQGAENNDLGSKYAELGSSCAGQNSASSAQSASSSEESSSGTTAKGSVATALSTLSYLKGKPELKAKYYIYLHSASWCGACCMEMPRIVSTYKELKEQGVEIILFGHDVSEGDVVAFAERYKAEFPVLKDSSELASKVPGNKEVNGIPHIIVVNRSGKVIVETHPSRFFANEQWKKYISEGGGRSE